jgi:hypothetical protein
MQSRIAAAELQDTVLPALPPTERTGIRLLCRRLEQDDIFDDKLLVDVASAVDLLGRHVDAGTRLAWEPDDGHVRGGYQVIRQDPGIAEISAAMGELDLLLDSALATLEAARAVREAEQLLNA